MKTLVAGFGNLLLGDDGFGVEVIRRLDNSRMPESVETVEIGIGGLDLVLRLQEGFDRLIIVDTLRRGDPPGTVTMFTPSVAETTLREGERIDPHVAEPSRAMKLARQFNVLPAEVIVIGCEAARCDVGVGLSPDVAAAVERALEAVAGAIAQGAG